MFKKTIAISFTVIFMALIIGPSIIATLDDSIDTSIFYSLAEEEENCKSKIVVTFSLYNNDSLSDFTLNHYEFFTYQFKNYSKPHLNLISPPPDKNIL
ncbi:hypothetical protein [Confluentibacter flavum]|uniref:Uncharacterized protein n=1 Tax=Confluentibacter flavum TaxID=1909700 RepID=A0A2N3HJ50_9FLAO|nr:hypothetical protein [Confluentibacter flavum]PKQ44986.1 hypothetical protein CSW08_10250 [Confluentibacter flavum]